VRKLALVGRAGLHKMTGRADPANNLINPERLKHILLTGDGSLANLSEVRLQLGVQWVRGALAYRHPERVTR
jgi:hypothetical protein